MHSYKKYDCSRMSLIFFLCCMVTLSDSNRLLQLVTCICWLQFVTMFCSIHLIEEKSLICCLALVKKKSWPVSYTGAVFRFIFVFCIVTFIQRIVHCIKTSWRFLNICNMPLIWCPAVFINHSIRNSYMWVVTLHSLFLYSDPPLPCHPPS
jgi:hypothetical protein